jgi:hypothetical protein
MADLFRRLLAGKAKIAGLSKTDFKGWYHQIKIKEKYRKFFAFATIWGTYVPIRILYGISDAPAIANQIMHEICAKFDVVGMVGDISWSAQTLDEGAQLWGQLYQYCLDNHIYIAADKTIFYKPEITFLGRRVSTEGVSPTDSSIAHVLQLTKPTTRHQLQSLMQKLNWLRSSIAGLGLHLAPLNTLLEKNHRITEWGAAHDHALAAAQECILKHPMRQFSPGRPTYIRVDASAVGMAAWLAQEFEDGVIEPVDFCSHAFNKAQRLAKDQDVHEAFGVVYALEHWKYLLYLHPVTIIVDNKPIISLLTKSMAQLFSKYHRWSRFVQLFDVTFQFEAGTKNSADYPSRYGDFGASVCNAHISQKLDLCDLAVHYFQTHAHHPLASKGSSCSPELWPLLRH